MSYKVEIVDKKDLIVQLEASKSSIKDLFNDLLNETKCFKYQITVKLLKRLKCKIIFVLMCFVMKMRWFFQFMFLIKSLKTL